MPETGFFEDNLNGGDYYPFGMLMVGRHWSVGTPYKYGFNGHQKEMDLNTSGNLNTAEFWEYDTRLGRRWNPDLVLKLYESPYTTKCLFI